DDARDCDRRCRSHSVSAGRCWGDGDPLFERYHDEEWGFPVLDEQGLFERLSLNAFQAGLSWRTILAKRDAFREDFADFDPDAVARFAVPTSNAYSQIGTSSATAQRSRRRSRTPAPPWRYAWPQNRLMR